MIITGATGSGKSTTLASMIHHINARFSRHIITIEDPIEFVHVDDKSIINQREVGYDTGSFQNALRHVVRQSPDVILIGEMRDQDTMMTAISAAETGHLVLTTLHTVDVFHTLDRIINYFPDYLKSQVRQELSMCLEGIVCMRLLRRKDGTGRVPALEILRSTPSIKKALLEGEFWKMREYIAKGRDQGMQTFNQALLDLYKQEVITFEEALFASSNPTNSLNAKDVHRHGSSPSTRPAARGTEYAHPARAYFSSSICHQASMVIKHLCCSSIRLAGEIDSESSLGEGQGEGIL